MYYILLAIARSKHLTNVHGYLSGGILHSYSAILHIVYVSVALPYSWFAPPENIFKIVPSIHMYSANIEFDWPEI